jgi:hypothetical protein
MEYKAALVCLVLGGISCGLLFRGRTATAAEPLVVPYTFATIDVPVPGAGSSAIMGINNRGDMVGSYNFISGAGAFGLPPGFLARRLCGMRMGHSLPSMVPGRTIPSSASRHSLLKVAITSRPEGSTIKAILLERLHRMC